MSIVPSQTPPMPAPEALAAHPDLTVPPVQTAPPSLKPETRVVFYCKDCEKIVVGTKIGNKYVYKCPLCYTKNVAFGTEKSIRSFYHVKDAVEPSKMVVESAKNLIEPAKAT